MIDKLKEFVEFNNKIVGACSMIFAEQSAARITFISEVVGRDNEMVTKFKSRTNKYLKNPFYENDVLIFTDVSNKGYMTWNDKFVDVYGYSFNYDGLDSETGIINIEELTLYLNDEELGRKRVRERMFKVFQAEYENLLDEIKKAEEDCIHTQQQDRLKAKKIILAQMKYHGISKEEL